MKNLTFPKVRERWVEEEDLHFKILLSIIIGKHKKMFLIKFNRNQTKISPYMKNMAILREGGGEGTPGGKETPIHKFLSQRSIVLIKITQ